VEEVFGIGVGKEGDREAFRSAAERFMEVGGNLARPKRPVDASHHSGTVDEKATAVPKTDRARAALAEATVLSAP
jgi:hypothetical protein